MEQWLADPSNVKGGCNVVLLLLVVCEVASECALSV